MSLLEVYDLQIAVRDGMAVDGVSFRLERGQVMALMGESGAGKSLTAAAVIGLLPPGSGVKNGSILLEGKRIEHLPAPAWRQVRGKRLCAVFQDPSGALDPLQTIGKQMAQTLATHHQNLLPATLRERVGDWLEAVGLEASLAQAYPHELTDSERQRAALAMAMCPSPDLLIADEPSAGLDMQMRAQLAALMSRLARAQGTSVLVISHDVRTALAAADTVAVMYAGRIVELGPAAEVLRRPRHPYVASLLASMPGLPERKGRLPAVSGRMPSPGTAPKGCVFRMSCEYATEQCRTDRPLQPETGAACFHPLPVPSDE